MMTWRERIVAARERGYFTGQDVRDASNWCSCAVGEQHAAMPTVVVYCDHEAMGPEDVTLQAYGGDSGFYRAVALHQFASAETLLGAIEDRVLVMKREATS